MNPSEIIEQIKVDLIANQSKVDPTLTLNDIASQCDAIITYLDKTYQKPMICQHQKLTQEDKPHGFYQYVCDDCGRIMNNNK